MGVSCTTSIDGLTHDALRGGFFEGWPDPPSPEAHLALLRGSRAVALAVDDADGSVVGFATAVGDGVLAAYIPLLEVLPTHRGAGLGTRLVQVLLEELAPTYMVDVCCDDGVVPFYERLGFTRSNGMVLRDYAAQSGSR